MLRREAQMSRGGGGLEAEMGGGRVAAHRGRQVVEYARDGVAALG